MTTHPLPPSLPPRRNGLAKLVHKVRHARQGKAYRAARRALTRYRGGSIAHFLHIRKAGGSAVKAALRPQTLAGPYLIELHPHRVTIEHVPPGEKVFFFVRDPVERFVSGFNSRKRRGAPANYIPWFEDEQRAFNAFPCANDLALALGGDDPGRSAEAQRAMKGILHVKSSYWDWFIDEPTLRARAGDILFVGRQSHLDEDFPRLREKLGLPASVTLPRDPAKAHRGAQADDKHLDPAAAEAIRRHYAADQRFLDLCVELFGLELDKPEHQPSPRMAQRDTS